MFREIEKLLAGLCMDLKTALVGLLGFITGRNSEGPAPCGPKVSGPIAAGLTGLSPLSNVGEREEQVLQVDREDDPNSFAERREDLEPMRTSSVWVG